MSENQVRKSKGKNIKFAVLFVLVIAAILFIYFIIGTVFQSQTNVSSSQTAFLTYTYDNKNIAVSLSDEESAALAEIFDGNELYFGNPSCGFTENVSISFGNQKFCIANDGCATVKLGIKYFNISENEQKTIDKIFTAHGGRIPCV